MAVLFGNNDNHMQTQRQKEDFGATVNAACQ
jgi:hypothetical protein